MSERPSEKISLGEAAYRRLRADIMSCRLAPGSRPTERQLAEITGFGASPIRSALTRLDHEGLVVTMPRKGYQVRPLTLRSIENLFDVWSLIGPEIFRRGIVAASAEQHAEIVRLTQSIGDARARPERLNEIADRVTRILAEATANDHLVYIHDRLSADMARVWMLVLDRDPDAAVLMSSPEHFDRIAERDGEALVDTVRHIIASFRDRVLDIVRQSPSVIDAEIVVRPSNSSSPVAVF